jgi:hypothetical protein
VETINIIKLKKLAEELRIFPGEMIPLPAIQMIAHYSKEYLGNLLTSSLVWVHESEMPTSEFWSWSVTKRNLFLRDTILQILEYLQK